VPVVAGFSRQTPKSDEARKNSTHEAEPTRARCRELRRGELPEGQPQLVLNLEGLPGGVYFCRIETEGEVVWRGKVVKQ